MHEGRTSVLVVDDNEADRATFRFFLEQQKLQTFLVEEAATGEQALEKCDSFSPDCVLLDYGLPDFDGMDVLLRIREKFGSASIAVVFLTGAGDELLAARALKSGAQDYIPKDAISPGLLSRSIDNALEKIALERERQRVQQALEDSERRLRAIVSTAPSVVYIFDLQAGAAKFVSDYSKVVIGYSPEEIMAMGPEFTLKVVVPEDRDTVDQQFRRLMEAEDGTEFECEYRIRHKDGSVRSFLSRDRILERDANGRVKTIVGAATDVTEKQEIEAALRVEQMRVHLAEEAAKTGFWDWHIDTDTGFCSAAYFTLYGLEAKPGSWGYADWLGCVHPEDRNAASAAVEAALAGTMYDDEFRVVWPDGSVHWLCARATLIKENGQPARLVGANIDITDRMVAEKAVSKAHARLEALMDVVPAAIFTAVDRESTRIDGNRMAYHLLELPMGANASKTAVDGDKPQNFQIFKGNEPVEDSDLPIQTVARTGVPLFGHECELRFEDSRKRYILGNILPLFDDTGQPSGALAAYLDVTDRKRIEQELRRSNQDLEHFASMAGHDLQEPLRSIISFAELIRRNGDLPTQLRAPLEFIRVGADRMKNLTADLLAYAQTATEARRAMTVVSLNETVQEALNGLQAAIAESDAQVVCEPLPALLGNPVLLKQLFQNLIGNGLKYRSEKPPHIRIKAEKRASDWLFFVQDNGIGMDMQYAELIFEPFKRLHGKSQYPGTGIGLAICKRVIEQHGGRIWVESRPGQGATFLFTLAESRDTSQYETWRGADSPPVDMDSRRTMTPDAAARPDTSDSESAQAGE